MRKKLITIGWLYPDLMNVYGDRGNIICLSKRLEWRGIRVKVNYLNLGFGEEQLASCDLLMMGGAQDRQQSIVNKDLLRIKSSLSRKIEDGIPGLFVCGGFQFLGKYYKEADGTVVEGLGIFDLYTENLNDKPRLIGDIAIKPLIDGIENPIIGFENHGGRTILGDKIKPFGKVLKGHGNNDDGFEGAIYRNSFGTYLHGPILPKNPEFTDHLLKLALHTSDLPPLDDEIENKARSSILRKMNI